MASIDFNPLEPGRFGRVILRRRGNRVFFAAPPRPRKGPGVARNKQAFLEAAAYSKAIFAHAQRRAPYETNAAKLRRPLYPLIMSDFLKQPVIRGVDLAGYGGRAGDAVVVQTRVDLDIAEVAVTVRGSDGEPIENGTAVRAGDAFRYVATTTVPAGTAIVVEITVRDRDGLAVPRAVPLTVA